MAIQQGHIKFPEGVITEELENFEYTYHRTGVSYSAPSGLHDDAVCALALAVQQWQQIGRYTMQLWGAEDAAPKTLAEMQQVEDERLLVAQQIVDEAVMSGSDVWFGRR